MNVLEFMGKNWDAPWKELDPPPAHPMQGFQLWNQEWLAECYRVLRPGGVIKSFSGSRTYHRLCAAMEEVGFVLDEERPLQAWLYGCLTDDAEILTEKGWKPGVSVEVGERVACWNPTTGSIRLEPVQEVIKAPFEGEMIVFRNDNTDQVLTPNHRVYKKHRIRKMAEGVRISSEEPNWNVQLAGEIDRWNPIRLPLAGLHSGTGVGSEDWVRLLAWVWTEGGFDQNGTGVRIYQSSVNMEHVEEIRSLVQKTVGKHSLYTRERAYKDRTYTEFCWFFSGEVALQVREALPEKRPTWDLLWRMSQKEKHVFVDAALKGDGSCSQGRWVFYQKNPEDLVWFQTLAHLMNRQGRINFRKNVVGLHMNPQTQLQSRHLKDASEFYQGEVWCVQVPTGAFLARRADKVFITGNSGFPKSLNVSKAIDAHLRHGKSDPSYLSETEQHRPVVGTVDRVVSSGRLADEGETDKGVKANRERWLNSETAEIPVTSALTPEAKKFEGYGTALKPAWEPVVVGWKPRR